MNCESECERAQKAERDLLPPRESMMSDDGLRRAVSSPGGREPKISICERKGKHLTPRCTVSLTQSISQSCRTGSCHAVGPIDTVLTISPMEVFCSTRDNSELLAAGLLISTRSSQIGSTSSLQVRLTRIHSGR